MRRTSNSTTNDSIFLRAVKCGQFADRRFFAEKPHRGGRFARIGWQKFHNVRCRAKILIIFLATIFAVTPVLADTPFQGYTYNFWGDLVPSPAAYVPVRSFVMTDICQELGDLFQPSDLHVDSSNRIYIVDSGNHRIIVFDIYMNLLRVIDGFYRDGRRDTFNRPHGIFVTEENEIFIADNQNNRVVIIDEYDNFIREITSPQAEGLADDWVFLPTHVLVDRGGRTFVIVRHVFEGMMSFDAAGNFIGYYGTIEVTSNIFERLWRQFFLTEQQRLAQTRFIPREFQSMDIDEYGFVFTTHVENSPTANQVMRLNPRGEDVLVNFNEDVVINGDQSFRPGGPLSGPSVFTDVIARSHGMFSALCSNRGRIYTYDAEGNLLYVFSGTGSLVGMSRDPVSLAMIGDDFLVLDAHGRGRIIHFAPSLYGQLINTAISLRYDGHDKQALEYWRQLVTLDENFALAWSGIGRSFLAAGDNAAAMYYLRRGMDVRNFSLAFRRHRLDVMQDTLPNILTAAFVLLALFVCFKIYRRFSKKLRPWAPPKPGNF
ncbi:MAG: gluconolactonase [Defluviitaleaceae bacterium]|nr:gluconolactonase [Defluviitaleaceae bacterium]